MDIQRSFNAQEMAQNNYFTNEIVCKTNKKQTIMVAFTDQAKWTLINLAEMHNLGDINVTEQNYRSVVGW